MAGRHQLRPPQVCLLQGKGMAFQIARLVAVVALLVGAAVLATPRGRLPVVLRGLWRTVHRDCGEGAALPPGEAAAGAWRRLLAFLMVTAAVALAVC